MITWLVGYALIIEIYHELLSSLVIDNLRDAHVLKYVVGADSGPCVNILTCVKKFMSSLSVTRSRPSLDQKLLCTGVKYWRRFALNQVHALNSGRVVQV